MKKVSEYDAHAAECRKMASQMSNPEHRKQLIEMAETWDMLAQARAKQLKREQNNDEPPESE
jgi:monoamine oxidase